MLRGVRRCRLSSGRCRMTRLSLPTSEPTKSFDMRSVPGVAFCYSWARYQNAAPLEKTAMKDSDRAGLAPIAYRVSATDPGSHRFDVVLSVPSPDPGGQCFALPAWIPGSYLIRDFARNLL